MTLEEIKGMNIPVGTPIELTLIHGNESSRKLGYFDRVYIDTQMDSKPKLEYDAGLDFKGKLRLSTSQKIPIDSIEKIKILQYKN